LAKKDIKVVEMNAWYGRDFIEIIETLKPVSFIATE